MNGFVGFHNFHLHHTNIFGIAFYKPDKTNPPSFQDMKENSDGLRKEMEQRMLATCKEQEEYTDVMCELRTKLERELASLQREHQQVATNSPSPIKHHSTIHLVIRFCCIHT